MPQLTVPLGILFCDVIGIGFFQWDWAQMEKSKELSFSVRLAALVISLLVLLGTYRRRTLLCQWCMSYRH